VSKLTQETFGDKILDLLTFDNLLHITGGASLAWLASYDYWFTAVLLLCILGWLREGAQHRKDGQWVGWITYRRMGEALAWGVGAGLFHLARALA